MVATLLRLLEPRSVKAGARVYRNLLSFTQPLSGNVRPDSAGVASRRQADLV